MGNFADSQSENEASLFNAPQSNLFIVNLSESGIDVGFHSVEAKFIMNNISPSC